MLCMGFFVIHFQSLTVSHFLINFYFLNTGYIVTKLSNNNFLELKKKKKYKNEALGTFVPVLLF